MAWSTQGPEALRFRGVSWDRDRISGSIEIGADLHPFFFSSSEPIGREADALFPIGLLLAMKAGTGAFEPPPGLSPRLLSRAPQIQDILHVWDRSFARTKVQAEARAPGTPTGDRVACFFSGGVDSFYSLLKHHDEITDLIFCLGFDLRLDHDPALLRQADSMAWEVAHALGKRLVRVQTDIRSTSDGYVSGWYFHGALLATIGLLYQHRFRKVLIPATNTYADLFPWGSHPLLDPLWSTEQTEFVHDGCETPRVDKVVAISSSDVAMDWLRVCWETPKGAYNCGRCEKCVRTMVSLRLAGALERCRTLPSTLDVGAVSRLPPHVENTPRTYLIENLNLAERQGDDPELTKALAVALKGGRRTDPRRWLELLRRRLR